MTPTDALSSHRSLVNENGQPIVIRRYTGTGPTRTHSDTATMAYVRNYGSKELVGSIIQGDQVAIALVDDLAPILPVRTTDKLVVAGAEYSIKNPMKRVVGGELIALEIHASG